MKKTIITVLCQVETSLWQQQSTAAINNVTVVSYNTSESKVEQIIWPV